uniref:Ig-like domain-containing protein n=1 Tax=Neolamprologus brichardi TaxID=32507 RepID=A0A3Q4H9F1_NEOBR
CGSFVLFSFTAEFVKTLITEELSSCNIVLPCKLDHPMDVVDEMVEWSRSDLNPRFVHVWRSGEDHLVGQNPSYKNRTSVSTEKLKTGDVSLKITKVRLSDEGTYRCFIPGLNFYVFLEADIEITEVSPGVLECKSKGWYPEPEVFWLENKGKIISAGSKEMLRGPDDLYVLSSRLTLEKGHSNNITCRIQQNNQYREAKIHVPG